MVDRSSVYWTLNGKGMEEATERLWDADKESLIALIINDRYNRFVSERADYREGDEPVDPTIANGRANGKRVPYHGWFWRSVNWYDKKIPIGKGSGLIGFMENNKWGHAERLLTEEEADRVIAVVDEAMRESERGGEMREIRQKTLGALERLWPLFQTFTDGEWDEAY